MLRLVRAFGALVLALGLVAPGLGACPCSLVTESRGPCCPDVGALDAEAGAPELDRGPCCCCASEPAQGSSPLPAALQRASLDAERDPGPALASSPLPEATRRRVVAASSIRPSTGPDPAPPTGLRLRRGVILLI